MDKNYISFNNLKVFLNGLRESYEVYIPVKKQDQRFYKKYDEALDNIVIGEVRAFEPLKAFFSKAREIVAEDFEPDIPQTDQKPFCIVGVKACDLKGFEIQDIVFKDHDYQDPFYIENRQENLIISADCTSSQDTCFCLALGLKPHPLKNFDINLSQLEDGFLVESGSKRGRQLLVQYSSLFEESKKNVINKKDRQRSKVIEEVEENIKKYEIPHEDLFKGIIERSYKSDIWTDEAKACVECGACTIICPTCHCFLLYDEKDKEKMARLRIWDSCMIKDYARVAGGANPRPKLWMRLRNRFEKKFDFFPKIANIYACTGCGRCILACPAKIDIRKVLKRLVNNA